MADTTINIFGSSGEAMVGADTINTILASMDSKLTSDDINIETLGDGTVDINVKNDTYTINLNHTHEGMAKLVKCTEATLPQVLADDTIYVQVDDATTPQEIESLWLFGLEFTGGSLPAGVPQISKPAPNSTINLGTAYGQGGATGTVKIKGKSLTANSTVVVSVGSGFSLSYGQQSGSSINIDAADVILGCDVTVYATAYGTSGTILITSQTDSLSVAANLTSDVFEDLQGVKFTGSQWLQTDYCPNPNTEFEMRCHFIENSNSAMQDLNNNKGYILRCDPNTGDGKAFVVYQMAPKSDAPNNSYGAGIINESSITYNGNYQIKVFHDNKTLFTTDNIKMFYRNKTSNGEFGFNIGGTEYKVNTSKKSSAMETPMHIGKANDGTLYCRFDLVIYELKITENGTVVRDWVPKKRDGVTGLLDIATNGTGTFLSSETAKTSGLASDELVAIPLT